jgi:hypothetical protein
MGIYPVGSLVRLSSGEHGVVLSVDPALPLKPLVKVVYDAKLRSVPTRYVDLASPRSADKDVRITEHVNHHDLNLDVFNLMG